MRSKSFSIGAMMLVAVWVPIACMAQTPPSLQDHLEARAAEWPDGLHAFYKERNFAPAWIGNADALKQAEELLAVVQASEQDGLVPDNYDAETLIAEVHRLQRGSQADAVHWLDLELNLTSVVFRYVSDLSQGHVSPSTLHAGWAETRRIGLLTCVQEVVASPNLAEALKRVRPPYTGYTLLQGALAQYRQMQMAGGWPALHLEGTLRLGDRHATVSLLRRRLAVTEDSLVAFSGEPDLFDEALEGVVLAFQRRHGLEADGIVGPQTLGALNVPVEERIQQIEYSLERWRWLPQPPDAQYLLVNTAGGRLSVFEKGKEVLAMKVIVGKPRTSTPLFHGKIEGVVLAPYWYVPASIVRNEIRPRLKRDPGYLARHDMHWMANGQLRQDPGPRNPLGRLKFIFSNRYSVGLHDTSEPHLFERSDCMFSHGCIRLEKPIELALYTLRGDTL